MSRRELLVRWGNLTFDVRSREDAELLSYILRNMQAPPEPKTVTVAYSGKFEDYLLRDRGLDPRTARDYLNYLRKLDGKTLDYNLYLSISGNRWLVKTVRLYVDYLYKTGQITELERDRLLSIFKVKTAPRTPNPRSVDSAPLAEPIKKAPPGAYRTILLLLYFTGARLSEVVRMLKTFSPQSLYCHDDFCRYFLGWRRGRKRADWLYFPRELLPSIHGAGSVGSYSTIRSGIHDYYHVKPKDYRKHFYQVCRDINIPKEVCDFYQSRVSALTVGDVHYDNLLKRADEHYPKIMEELKKRGGLS